MLNASKGRFQEGFFKKATFLFLSAGHNTIVIKNPENLCQMTGGRQQKLYNAKAADMKIQMIENIKRSG